MKYYLSVFKNYGEFGGRARRAEFWWFTLVSYLVSTVIGFVDEAVRDQGIVGYVYVFATVVPSIAVTVRRLHDTDHSAWNLLLYLIPIVGWIILIVFCCQDGTPGPNRYGQNPKGDIGTPYGYSGPYGYGGPQDAGPQDAVPYPYGR